MAAVAQIGAPITFSAGTTANPTDVNSNFADFRTAFNNLVTGANAIAVDTIAENTSATGVTIDGVLIKDNGITMGGTLAGAVATFSSTLAVTGTSALTGNVGIGQAAGNSALAVTEASEDKNTLILANTHASLPQGLDMSFVAASPDDRTQYFFRGGDSGGTKVKLWSDGGATFTGLVTGTSATLSSTLGVTGAATLAALTASFANTVSGTGLMVTTNDTSAQELMRDSSSARFKENIEDAEIDIRAVMAINPKNYGRPGSSGRYLGFIVEDFHEAGFGDIIAYDDEGPAGFLEFGRGITALHHAVLRSHDGRIESNEEKIERLEFEIAALKEFN